MTAVVILVIAVLAALYFYYGKSMDTGVNTNTPAATQNNGGAFEFPVLTSDETASLNFPKSGATPEAVLAHAGSVHKAAKTAEVVVIGESCRTSPAVLSLKKGQKISFQNRDTREHIISFDATHTLSVPAGKSASLDMGFGEEEHIYGYGCESSSSPVGVVLIVR